MENIEFTRFIERYLDNKMQSSEKRWFEKEMEGNLWLRKELELRRKANEFASNTAAIDLRAKLQKAELRHRTATPIDKAVKKVPANYAALFLGLVIISSLLFFSGKRINLDTYTGEAVDRYNALTTHRSGDSYIPEQLTLGMELYSQGDYLEAAEQFQYLIENKKSIIHSSFLNGMARMQVKEYGDAIKSFDVVIEHNDNMFIEDASYYLGLCYLNIEDSDRARTILEGIISSESRYRKDAKKILKTIK